MTVTPPKRWLVISHAFNMDGRAASQTITDKLPHLREAGIEIVVLSGVSGTKDKLLEHYQLWPMGPAGFRSELHHFLKTRLESEVIYRLVMLFASLLLSPLIILEKLFFRVESSWSWWISAYLKGVRLTHEKDFDLIYSTGSACAAHIAGRVLKRVTGTPWMAEVHDPLVLPGDQLQNAQKKMQSKVEKNICSDADIAIWFTDQALASAKGRHPELGMRGKMIIPGVDQPAIKLAPYQKGSKFILGHFGSLSPSRTLKPIIDALDILIERDPSCLETIELHVYGGQLDSVSSALIGSRVSAACVRYFGRLEMDPKSGLSGRDQILQRMRSADALLLLHGNDVMCSEYIPSKLYEYLWMQRPILAVVHNNPQMLAMVLDLGHFAVESGRQRGNDLIISTALAKQIEMLKVKWEQGLLNDRSAYSPHTTKAAVNKMLNYFT